MKKIPIGKVCKIVDLPQSVLRYWESVFPEFSPYKSEGGTRRYSQEDVDIILEIKDLLYNRKYTIAGAKSTLANRSNKVSFSDSENAFSEIVEEIDIIIKELSGKK